MIGQSRVVLIIGPCFSSVWIFCANPFWPEMFLLRNQLTVLWEFPCSKLLLRFIVFNFCHFYYDVSLCGPLWVNLVWGYLCFLVLCNFFLHQVRGVFSHYFFYQVLNFLLSLLLVPLWCGCWYPSCFPRSLKLSSLIFFFLFGALIGWGFFLLCFPSRWFDPLLHPPYFFIPSSAFFLFNCIFYYHLPSSIFLMLDMVFFIFQ